MKRLHFLCLLFLLFVIPAVIAQEACPANVIRAFARAGAACTELERNQVCFGNGTVQGVFDSRASDSFALVGERADVGLMQQLIVSSETEYSIASMQLQMSLINTETGSNVSLLAFGNVTLSNQVPVRPLVPVEATGVMNIRALPDIDADILAQYPLRTTVMANGILVEGDWLRVQIPDTSEIGWLTREFVTTTGDLSNLNIVDVDTPFLRPYQLMSLVTGQDDAQCAGTPESGILLQSPNLTEAVEMTLNGLEMRLSGTVFVQAVPDSLMLLQQIEGNSLIRLGNERRWIVAGAEIALPLDTSLTVTSLANASPLTVDNLAGVPVNNLNYRVSIPKALTQTAIDTQIAALDSVPLVVANDSMMNSERCNRIVSGRAILYAGPGTFYEVIREINRGTRLYPVLRLTDTDGVSWWQLSNGHWMLASEAEITGNCGEIPVTEIVQAPYYNTLVLETCDMLNGPIRAGQYVDIQFTDGGWETIGEALRAPQIDPGRVTVNQESLWVYADDPIQVQPERYYRLFHTSWYAQAGTFRIIANRLSYSVICDITVPLG
jgi:hypothetical protein